MRSRAVALLLGAALVTAGVLGCGERDDAPDTAATTPTVTGPTGPTGPTGTTGAQGRPRTDRPG